MKSVLFAFLVAATLAACSKKEEPVVAPVVTPAKEDVTTKQDAQNVPAPAASEPAKTEEAKK